MVVFYSSLILSTAIFYQYFLPVFFYQHFSISIFLSAFICQYLSLTNSGKDSTIDSFTYLVFQARHSSNTFHVNQSRKSVTQISHINLSSYSMSVKPSLLKKRTVQSKASPTCSSIQSRKATILVFSASLCLHTI